MKNEQQGEAQAELPEPLQKHPAVPPSHQSQTAFLYEYLSLLQAEQKLKVSSLIEQLKAYGIQYNSQQDHNQFYLRLIHHSNNYRTLTLQVVLGPFTTLLNIFSETEASFIHELNCLYGCFGNVYLLEWGADQEVAIKCIPIREEERPQSTMLRTIKQYTINKIASALRVGPRIIKIQEFDLITYDKCIEFCMEKCCLAEEYTLTEEDHDILKLNLKKLHALGIVHCDIKHSNIVYSRSYKSPVFLDFGFSKVLSTGPGVPTKTKYVGSLESCCKEMVQLYLNKEFGLVDLYYNDAYSLKTSLQADPIRQTGNDLSEIVKSCDPPSLSFHFAKIYFYLYRDQTFNATNEYLKTRRSDKKQKIMGYLDTLPPTENLREFYFGFFEREWQESVQFRDLVQLYTRSHRHHLQLGYHLPSEQPISPPFYFNFMEKVFNRKINLFQLDNDLINYSELCLGLADFTAGKLSFEDESDFFLENAGLLVDNYFIRTRDFSLGWRICNIYFGRIPEDKMGTAITESERLFNCFSFLADYCLDAPITDWKLKVFRRTVCEVMIQRQTTIPAFETYLTRVLGLACPLQKKLNLLHSLYKSLMFQTAVWGSLFSNCEDEQAKLQQLGEKLEVQFYRLATDDEYLQNLIKLDHFLLKSLLRPDNRLGEIEAIEITFVKLKKEHAKQREQFLRFIKAIYLFENQYNQQCRLEIERALSVSEVLIILKPEYFILGMVYRRLRNSLRSKRIYHMIQSCAMSKDFIYENPRMLSGFIEVEKVDSNCLLDLKTIKPCMYLVLVLKGYFEIKNSRRSENIEPLNAMIEEITKDDELVTCINQLNQSNCTIADKISLYEKLIHFFSSKLSECGKDLADKIKDAYIEKLILEKLWLSGEYDQILKHLTHRKMKKQTRFQTLEQDPTTFDFTVKAYLMLGRLEKAKSMIRSLEEEPFTEPRFIERWILTTSFSLFFQYLLEKNVWQDFRDFLLALVDFMDIHPVQAFINSYAQSIRFALNQRTDFTLIDSGLQTIIFPRYQWKYPLLSFFHIEALSKMASIPDYLNRKELQLYLWRLTPFLPYLTASQLKWFLQEYFPLLLKLSPNERYRRTILLKCRSLISFRPTHHHHNYHLIHIQLLPNKDLLPVMLRKLTALDGFISEDPTPLLTHFKEENFFTKKCMKKLRRYHQIAGNDNMREILKNFQVLMRMRMDR